MIVRGQKGKIELQASVPIGCYGELCTLTVHSYVPAGRCKGSPSFETYCGVDIENTQWNVPHAATIAVTDSYEYEVTGIFEIYFETIDVDPNNLIWANYKLPPVTV